MALSNWFNANLLIDLNKGKVIKKNVREIELGVEDYKLDIYKNILSIRRDKDNFNLIQFNNYAENHAQSELFMSERVIRVEKSINNSFAYAVYFSQEERLFIGICGIDDKCRECNKTDFRHHRQDVYFLVLKMTEWFTNLHRNNKDFYLKIDHILEQLEPYNQGGRKYPNLFTVEHIDVIEED